MPLQNKKENPHGNTAFCQRNRDRAVYAQRIVLIAAGLLIAAANSGDGFGHVAEVASQLTKFDAISSFTPVVGASALTMDQFVDTFPGLRSAIVSTSVKKRKTKAARGMSGQEAAATEASSSSNTLLLILLDIILIGFAALFAGLTLAVMGLDTLSLEILSSSGREPDKTYATKILPVRKLGNLLLCTLLFGNVMVITGVSQVTNTLLSGWKATLVSTVLICLGGEIIPQATMSAYALQVGSRSTTIVKLFVFMFYPLCKPIAMFLDVTVGSDPGQIYERNELKDLMMKHVAHSSESGLEKSDLDLLVGAMELREKTVLSAMTPLADVYMIEASERITEDLLSLISEKGHSRIPVYLGSRNNVVGVLHAKDLLLARPEENTKVITLVSFYQRKFHVVPSESKLISILRHFQTGHTHISLVQEVRFRMNALQGNESEADLSATGSGAKEAEGDPYYEVLGIITLEDVVEELLHAEIFDEHDLQAFRRTAEDYADAESLYSGINWATDEDNKSPQSNAPLIMGGGSMTNNPTPNNRNLGLEAAHFASVALRLYHSFHRSHRRIHLSLNQLAATAYFLQRNIPELSKCDAQLLLKALTKGGTGRLESVSANSETVVGGPFCSVMRVKVSKDASGLEWPSYKRITMKGVSGGETTATVLDNNHNVLLYVAGSPLHATFPPKEAVRYCAFRLQHQRRAGTASVTVSGPAPPSAIHIDGCMTVVLSGKVEAASAGERVATHPLPTNTVNPSTLNSSDLITSGSGVSANTGLVAELPSWSAIGVESMRNGVTVTGGANGVVVDTNTVDYTCRVVQDALILQMTTSQFAALKKHLSIP